MAQTTKVIRNYVSVTFKLIAINMAQSINSWKSIYIIFFNLLFHKNGLQ